MRITLALVFALGGCGAVDTLGDRLEDAAGELRAAGGRFARHLGVYLEAEGCTIIRRHAPWAPALFGICEDPR